MEFTSQMNLGNTSKELYYFDSIHNIPKTFTGACKFNPGLLSFDENDIYIFKDGEVHCEDGPAVYFNNGSTQWYQNGIRHREGGPACEDANGDKHWYQNGQLHRINGPAYECLNGNKAWYQNGKRHRLDGPAIEFAGLKIWCLYNEEYGRNNDFNNQSWQYFQRTLLF